jgi:uncharacterized membrane protein
MKLKNLPWIPFAFFAIAIGLYPLTYYLVDMHDKGLFSSKPLALINSIVWHTAFYIHISFGGIAMLTGWTQFSQRLRNRYLNVHRTVGKIYIISLLLSGCAGLYIAFFATGGIISATGFGTLALLWLFTIIKAYASIRRLRIKEHQQWMIRNYALTFAAVTLRIYLPLFMGPAFRVDFILAYHIISWLCWVPNIIVAEIIISRLKKTPVSAIKPV